MVPSISVVIPVHNRPVLLSRALTSVSCQTTPPLEVVVVDDGSSQPIDDTLKELCPGVKIIRNDKNAGVAAARNRGIEHAQGEWIALLDSDDEWVSLKLEKQVQYLQEFPHLRAIHTDEKWVRNNNEVNPPVYLNKSNQLLWERSLRHCLICPSSVLLHISIFETIGSFDQSFTVCEDYDFWLRLLLHDEIGLVDEKLTIKHGGHADQLSTNTWGMDRFRIKTLQKILSTPLLSLSRRKLVYEVLIDKCRILAQGSKKRQKTGDAEVYQEMAEKYSVQLSKTIQHVEK